MSDDGTSSLTSCVSPPHPLTSEQCERSPFGWAEPVAATVSHHEEHKAHEGRHNGNVGSCEVEVFSPHPSVKKIARYYKK